MLALQQQQLAAARDAIRRREEAAAAAARARATERAANPPLSSGETANIVALYTPSAVVRSGCGARSHALSAALGSSGAPRSRAHVNTSIGRLLSLAAQGTTSCHQLYGFTK